MKGWKTVFVYAGLVGAIAGAQLLGVVPRPTPSSLFAVAFALILVSTYRRHQAQDNWPLDGSAPSFEAVSGLVFSGACDAAALVMLGLAFVGGFSR